MLDISTCALAKTFHLLYVRNYCMSSMMDTNGRLFANDLRVVCICIQADALSRQKLHRQQILQVCDLTSCPWRLSLQRIQLGFRLQVLKSPCACCHFCCLPLRELQASRSFLILTISGDDQGHRNDPKQASGDERPYGQPDPHKPTHSFPLLPCPHSLRSVGSKLSHSSCWSSFNSIPGMGMMTS